MPLETWLAYTFVTASFLLIPGPTILLVISYSLIRGRQAVFALLLGVGLGDVVAMLLSFIGVGLLLQTVSIVFQFFMWIGAAYLIWLGIRMLRDESESLELSEKIDPEVWHAIIANAFVITALNPKSIVFFLAFLPQFINSEESFITQSLILGSTFLGLALLSVVLYSLLSSFIGQQMRLPLIHRWTNRIGGSLLIGAGGMIAFK
jgi:threonine/homoserine/homoserine lactone efflux protein|tara:strand:+ start:1897 stop:2511 length:615 start_codon:yes stop_codon:yes gene_type:complete